MQDEMLKELHTRLAERLLDRIKEKDVKASDLNVARQFLKDNGIESLPVDNSPLQKLIDEMPFAEKRKNPVKTN
jgi:hypothetical protein